jgi:hypothetical protein
MAKLMLPAHWESRTCYPIPQCKFDDMQFGSNNNLAIITWKPVNKYEDMNQKQLFTLDF